MIYHVPTAKLAEGSASPRGLQVGADLVAGVPLPSDAICTGDHHIHQTPPGAGDRYVVRVNGSGDPYAPRVGWWNTGQMFRSVGVVDLGGQ